MKQEIAPIKKSLAIKLQISFTALCVALGLLITTMFFFAERYYLIKGYDLVTKGCARDVANILYDMPVDKFLNNKESELYNLELKALKNIAKTFELQYLYVYVPDIKNDKLIPIMGIDGETGNKIKNFGIGEDPGLNLNPEVINMYNAKGNDLNIFVNNKYGAVFSGYSTVLNNKNEQIAIVGADISLKTLQDKLWHDIARMFFVFLALFYLVYKIISMYFYKKFLNPILQLTQDMQNFTETGEVSESRIATNTDDEFSIIGTVYNLMVKEKKRLNSELSLAKSIQASALPSKFPAFPDRYDFDIYADMITAKEVGGDFYDFFLVDDDNFVFLIADVSGKGVPAALFMMQVKMLLQNSIKPDISLAEAMNEVNNKICQNNKQGLFVTVFVSMVNLKTGKVTFVNAGHNPPLLKRKDEEYKYAKLETNLVIGAMENFKYVQVEKQLEKGDEVFLYTDGVTEAMDENQNLYGEKRLQDVLNSAKILEIKNIIPLIKQDIENYAQNTEQSDDITMLIFKYNGN